MICPTSSQPRFHKRANQLARFNRVKILAFKRGLYEQSTFSTELEFHSLGEIKDGNYLKRLKSLFKAIFKIRKIANTSVNPLFYAFSIDCLLIAKLAGIKIGFYEVGDLRVTNKSHGLFTVVERLLLNSAKKIIITSDFFYDEYFKLKGYERNSFQLIENKLSYEFFRGMRPLQCKIGTPKKLKIGVIGLLRYERPLKMLINLVLEYPDKFILDCYGDGPCKNLFINNANENITYHGSFKYPDQLPQIYDAIDLNFVVYENTSQNVRLALPNKLYESAFFGVPLLSAENTALESKVIEYGIGESITISEQREFNRRLLNLTDSNRLIEYKEKCFSIHEDELIDQGHLVIEQIFKNMEKK